MTTDNFCSNCGYVELDVHGCCSKCRSEHVTVRPPRKYSVYRSTNGASGRHKYTVETGLGLESARRLCDSLTTEYRLANPLVSSWVADLFICELEK